MRDDDELRVARHLAHEADEALVVDLVERGIDLIEQAEGARLVAKDREEERERGERALAAGEQSDRLRLLAWRLRDDLDPALEDVFLIEQLDSGAPAAEERLEDLDEIDVDRRERLAEELARGDVDLADRLPQRLDCLNQIVALRAEEVLALFELLVLLDREDIDRADPLDLLGELRDLRVEVRARLVALGRQASSSMSIVQ